MIKKKAKELGASLCGIGKIYTEINPKRDPLMILPNAKCIIGCALPIPKGFYKTMESESQFYTYTSMGVKYIDEEMAEIIAQHKGKVEYWRTTDRNVADSVAVDNRFFDENDIPKVLPETDFMAINLNRLYGKLPDWLLYHPKLDQWYPDLLIWSQEGRAKDGNKAGFSNAPTNMNYYYDIYVNKKYNPKNFTEE